ncbi:protein PIP-1-like [Podarcis raffonei]|uniref:protein PIP-1-like n=1 Tax=Podarcis raffonei TaxID=65483 RepID=UPI0023293CE6|nr:protein PIP-1-like [Podarcis raffonei]XP_053223524.1 protein PIP-1-like [Podarcis raffonei]
MKAPMNKIVALGFLIILSLAAVGGLKCHKCTRVRKDNTCSKQKICDVSPSRFCFIQRISKGGNIRRVHRGCTSVCVTVTNLSIDYIKYTYCCQTDYCNKNNIWQLY